MIHKVNLTDSIHESMSCHEKIGYSANTWAGSSTGGVGILKTTDSVIVATQFWVARMWLEHLDRSPRFSLRDRWGKHCPDVLITNEIALYKRDIPHHPVFQPPWESDGRFEP